LLQLPVHKLIQDIPTRWNSSYVMIERYIEQQAAVYSAMTDKAVKKNVKDIMILSENDMRLAENVITVLKPLKTVTTLMCTESSPSASMVLPMKMMILKSMSLSDDDSPAVRNVKKPSKMTCSSDTRYLIFKITYTRAQLWIHDLNHCNTWMLPLTPHVLNKWYYL